MEMFKIKRKKKTELLMLINSKLEFFNKRIQIKQTVII